MHKSSYLRMKWFIENFSCDSDSILSVLDIGSCAVNTGDELQTYKNLFPTDKYKYFGLDMSEGPNVDIVVEKPYHWKEIEDETFDIVISGQVFEHIEFFWETMKEIARVMKKGGVLAIVAPSPFGVAYHGCPVDCYRFFADGMTAVAKYAGLETIHSSVASAPKGAPSVWYETRDAFLIAKKGRNSKPMDIKEYEFEMPELKKLRTDFIPDNYENEMYHEMFGVQIDGTKTLHVLKPLEMVQLWALNDKEFLIWGTGGLYNLLYRKLVTKGRPHNLLGFVDNNPEAQNSYIDGYKVFAPDKITESKPDIILIASTAKSAILKDLENILGTRNPLK